MGIKIGGQIEKVKGKELSYSEFVEKYMAKNRPVVLTGLMDDWRACKDWDGQPNLQFFYTRFGKSKVQVADCVSREFTDQKRVEMSVSEFVKHWLENYFQEKTDASTTEANSMSVLYLKDWHFVKDLGLLFTQMFSDHIVGRQMCAGRNDGFFCLLLKVIWCLTAPLKPLSVVTGWWNLKSCVYNIFDDVSETNFPGFKKANWLECTQEQNEIIFVPSGWYHQVHNLEDTISINHNWFNGYNLSWVWDLLLRDYNEAKDYIEDIRDICDDFEGLCQRNLAANTGMNFNDFFTFISRFSLMNVVHLFLLLRDYENPILSSSSIARHLALNLVSIRKIALKMKTVVVPTGNCEYFINLKETLDDPQFLKLCSGLSRTYGMVHKQQKWSCELKKSLMVDLEGYGSLISTPEDLVKFINYAAGKLNGSEENILLSNLDDA